MKSRKTPLDASMDSASPKIPGGEGERAPQYYDRFFELSFDLLCIAGFDGYFKLLSPSWAKTLGYSLEELMARPFVEFVHPDDRQDTIDEAAKIAEGAITVSFDNRYKTKSGEYRWLYWSAVPDPQQNVILAVARDITERTRVAEELRRAKESAEAANQAKSEFLAQMSHELRTPLNSVIGFADVLMRGDSGALNPVQRDYLSRVRSNGEHLLNLINQVLDLAKVEAGRAEAEIETIDLRQLVATVVDQFEGQLHGRPITLVTEVPEDLDPIHSDSQMLKQILINLVGNAVKFTEKGRIVVRIGVDSKRPSVPVVLEVEDTGIGIPEEAHSAIFETFEQVDHGTSRSFEGTGLGLAICASLCELLGYGLRLRSRPGQGTTFSVDLDPQRRPHPLQISVETAAGAPPVDPADVSTAEDELRQDGEPVEAGYRERTSGADLTFSDKLVLVVDDDSDARMLLTHALHDLGCQVLTATSGRHGLRLAIEHRPDLVTLDLLMPEVSGWDLLNEFRALPELHGTPVVVVSGALGEAAKAAAGALEVLAKPVDQVSFREAVVRALKHLGRGG